MDNKISKSYMIIELGKKIERLDHIINSIKDKNNNLKKIEEEDFLDNNYKENHIDEVIYNIGEILIYNISFKKTIIEIRQEMGLFEEKGIITKDIFPRALISLFTLSWIIVKFSCDETSCSIRFQDVFLIMLIIELCVLYIFHLIINKKFKSSFDDYKKNKAEELKYIEKDEINIKKDIENIKNGNNISKKNWTYHYKESRINNIIEETEKQKIFYGKRIIEVVEKRIL